MRDYPCYCEGCKRDTFKSPKYGREHWEGCVCEACNTSYREHNKRLTCACSDCDRHRKAIYPPAPKKPKKRNQGGTPKMASINLCERCGVMAKSTAMGGVQHWLTPAHNMTGPAELCPGCVNDFLKFMAGEPAPIGDRPKAYHKPWEEPAKSDPLAGLSTEQLAAAFLARQADEQARELEQ